MDDQTQKAVERGDMVVVSRTAWEQFKKDSEFLANLEAAGVDNWDGYHYGYTGFEDFEDEEEG